VTSDATPTVGDAIAVLERRYPPEAAEDWDSVGLSVGHREAPVRRVLFAIDPLPAVIDEAIAWGADLLVTHHPLLLRPVHGVATDTWKGKVIHDLIRAECALFAAHTNADVAGAGVNDALAAALGMRDTVPLRSWPHGPTDKVVTFVPVDATEKIIDAMASAGAGSLGDYTRCAWTVPGTGTFTPQPGATPVIGAVGETEVVPEYRVEMLVPRRSRDAVLTALRSAHPYEEVAVDVIELAAMPSSTGLGRVGVLSEDTTLANFARTVAAALPRTPRGIIYFGDGDRPIRRVAVCGGAGDGLLTDATRAGVDAFVTADLRHHPASEHLADGGPALIDPGHWASEWPWLPFAASALAEGLNTAEVGATTVETRVSMIVTDPASGWVPSSD
jgi:dinuclear metal center YbgI/SA1388 family protein